ncbi:hypothetical protein FGE05_20175 [Pseudomonas sp. ICMP22404]|nr:hypothetical protein FGE05_20175 [Pseudomonas sp. ICMP22404]
MFVPMLGVGMSLRTLRVRLWDAERPWLHSHAERGNETCESFGLLGNPHQLRVRVDVMPAALALVEQRPEKAQPYRQP